ncbi:FAD binding domain-containing protein [Chlorogloeopsis fritschii PCC 9212]|uniref:Putative oxidoreductase (Molybdopterin dehydrogenase) n=1 Tax=Chlorogloeopsis fritschii PCC 6912 TaxID=211165 RepID=A0A3S0XPE1_CHLFR|nr:FAD binding domain-containing protein [Chlorogloeopsis fritschii]RUR77438.1 putative oxidoreductase (molybdopterin dehydrogenase) [Chlorogloeopsis fritschii PCC 6912]
MDLPNIENHLSVHNIQSITNWDEGWAWLAGGTWLFSELQPSLKVLVDMQPLGWSEIEVVPFSDSNSFKQVKTVLSIGATCPLSKLLQYSWPPEWRAVEGLKSAVSALSASMKVINMATVGGNICLALSVGTFAPLMVALDATYEIWNLKGETRRVAAKEFQVGYRQTILQPQEVLRRVLIPVENLKWQVNYQRIGIAASDPALAIVVSACNPDNLQLRCAIAASVTAPILLDLHDDRQIQNFAFLQEVNFIDDAKASAIYRREVTQVLIKRSLKQLKI